MDQKRLEKYTKTYGTRFTIRQKKRFRNALFEDMKLAGYDGNIWKKRKFLNRSSNIFFGDIERAKTIICVPYDTVDRKFWWKVAYYPLDGTKSNSSNTLPTFGPIMIVYVLAFIALTIGGKYVANTIYADWVQIALFFLVLLMAYVLLQGFANHKNYNRNSASIEAAIAIANKLDKAEKSQVGFLFLDQNRVNYLGASSAKEVFEENKRSVEIIYLNCIAKGSTTCIGYNPHNKKRAEEIAKFDTSENNPIQIIKLSDKMRAYSPMFFFERAVVISSGDLNDKQDLVIYGTGTNKDIDIDENKIQRVEDMIIKFLKDRISIRRKR